MFFNQEIEKFGSSSGRIANNGPNIKSTISALIRRRYIACELIAQLSAAWKHCGKVFTSHTIS